ncbi:methylmalonyl-CoA mutase family protein [Hirschia litorea]|uniref:Methylmalonyl-CoA mutase family protein n=1 Tax=Hirschia litorea TaxID=1199156 RepID=A0ABW2IH66_9PROT
MTSNNIIQFSSEFDGGDEAQWLDLLDKALKGKPAASINTKTYDGLTVKALYRDTDWESSTDKSGLPGQAPFMRGSEASRDKFLPWDIRQIISHPDPAEANKSILEDLEHGVSSIELRIDENGDRGVCIRTLADLQKTLEDVKLDWAPIGLEVTASSANSGLAAAAMLAFHAEQTSETPEKLNLAFNYDPIGVLARTGHLNGEIAHVKSSIVDLVTTLSAKFEKSTLLRADARPIHESGGSEAQELSGLIASGTFYLRTLVEAGIDAATALRSINFTMSVGADYIIEIAKLRAARRMWAKVASEFGVADSDFTMKIQAVSSRRMLTARDPWVNILRVTAACFAAGVGGAEIATMRPFTDALGLPSRQARRIARNTHIIAQEESFLGKVLDPAGGTWSIAALSNDLALKAWSLFQDIEKGGGIISSLTQGKIQSEVSKIRAERLSDVAFRKVQITGVSDYPLLDETPAEFVIPDLDSVLAKATPPKSISPSSYALSSLMEGAQNGLTLPDLTLEAEDTLECDPLWPIRIAKPFERLRDFAEAFEAKNKIKPKIFIAAIGPLAEHTARTSFATNFFGAGGLHTIYQAGTPDQLATAFKQSGCLLACICGSDERYLQEAADTARALGAAGAGRLYLAGRAPAEIGSAWQEAGIDEFIHVGVDVVSSLELAHSELGLAL